MADFKLTENQKIAVKDRSGTLLVAAAAGSGKTAILTQRIVEKLCDPLCDTDISRLLIVTFTKAATYELKERLYKALSKYVQKNPQNARARRQLSLMGLAKISTIHSFCLDIIRSNFEAIGLPAKIKMGEETEMNILMRQVLEEILEEKYNIGNVSFLKLMEIMSDSRSDEKFIEALLDLYKKIRSLPEKDLMLDYYLDMYECVAKEKELFDTHLGMLIENDFDYELSKAIEELICIKSEIESDKILFSSLGDALTEDINNYFDISLALLKGYSATREAFKSMKVKKAKPIKNHPNPEYAKSITTRRSKCKEKIKGIFNKYLSAEAPEIKLAAQETKELLSELFNILKLLQVNFSAKKLEKGLLDYCDLEQYSLKLLVEDTGIISGTFRPTPLAKALSRDYAEIYVDEYQDTNMIQDLIFRAISTYGENGEENNRFLVGDVKQSIYRFRGAQPDIFKSYIQEFPSVNTEKDEGTSRHKIYLSNNFRCSKNVVGWVNAVFENIMDMYTDDDKLIYSKIEENPVNSPCEFVLIENKGNDEDDKEQVSCEALYIAKRIKEMAYNPDFLSEKGEMYHYSDFVILSRSANSVSPEYRRAFRYAGIPLSCDTPEDFFTLPEIMLVICLLNCIDNPRRDIYVAGCMHSVIFGFSADELAEIRCVERNMSFMQSVEKYAEENTGELCEKITGFLDKIKKYRDLSRGTSTDVLLRMLYDEFSILELHAEKTHIKQKNLMRLYELSRTFEKTSFKGLSAFLDYLSGLANGNFEHKTESGGDSVKFMSIHRSKGLEFPVVILSGAMREFNLSDERTAVVFSAKNGVGMKLRSIDNSKAANSSWNYTLINTPFREAIIGSDRMAMIEEEKRLLYVAMTRARDRLIVTALTKDAETTLIKAQIKRQRAIGIFEKYSLCYFDFLCSALTDKQFSAFTMDNSDSDDYVICKKYVATTEDFEKVFFKKSTDEQEYKIDIEQSKLLHKMLSEIKSTEKEENLLSKIPAKLSVSQLKKGLLDEEENSSIKHTLRPLPYFMQEINVPDASEKGTATHIFMQFASYENIESQGTRAEAKRLCSEKFITQRMYEIIDFSEIEQFIRSGLYEKIKKSPRLYRERRFNLRLPVSEFTKNTADTGDFILVQGVSDLYFENGDGTLTLVDFKTDRVSKDDDGEKVLKERHTEQLIYYKRAIEEITGKRVCDVYIYSFCLGREVLLDI